MEKANLYTKIATGWKEVKSVYVKTTNGWKPIWAYSWKIGTRGSQIEEITAVVHSTFTEPDLASPAHFKPREE